MHLFLYARGVFSQVELWKCHAQVAYWKFRRMNKETGKEETILVQGALRPSVLGAYEYIFPEESLAEVCSFFGIVNNEQYGFRRLGLNLRHIAMRKIFGCKKIPKKILNKAKEMPSTFTTKEFERGGSNCIVPGVAVHVIGVRKDKKYQIGKYFQEAL